MKLAKISLATLVALGAFSSVASATPLEEAIKDVDFSGFARYRYTNDKITTAKGPNTTIGHNANADHRFRFMGTFKAALDDNFFGVLSLRYDARDGSGNTNNDTTNTTTGFGVKQFYLGYKIGNTTITAGKQFTGTFFDDDLAATGIRVVNTDIQGLTLAAVAFDALEGIENNGWANRNGNDFDGGLYSKMTSLAPAVKAPNLYGVGVMGSYDPVSFKFWWAQLTDLANLFAVDAAVKLDLEAVKLGLQGQYVRNESDHDRISDANFYAVKGDFGAFGANINAGYINFKANDANTDFSFVSIEDNGKLINPSKVLNVVMNGSQQYYNSIKDKNDYWFVGLGYSFDKFNVYANYIDGKGYSWRYGERVDRNEWNVGGSFKYSKKLTFSGFYARATEDRPANILDDTDNRHDRIRFETRYNF